MREDWVLEDDEGHLTCWAFDGHDWVQITDDLIYDHPPEKEKKPKEPSWIAEAFI